MRVVIQRVSGASVSIDDKIKADINQGLLILLGIEESDTLKNIQWLCKKIANLRIFSDENGKMNKSIIDIKGEMIVVSQFTLYGNAKKGNRPSYIRAAKPAIAIPLYKRFISELKYASGLKVESGEFGANMQVSLVNDGPVTIIIDSDN